jgi:hypothetical protein
LSPAEAAAARYAGRRPQQVASKPRRVGDDAVADMTVLIVEATREIPSTARPLIVQL